MQPEPQHVNQKPPEAEDGIPAERSRQSLKTGPGKEGEG